MTKCTIYGRNSSFQKKGLVQINPQVYYNKGSGEIHIINRYSGLSVSEVTQIAALDERSKLDPVKTLIACDWKRHQDSFQMVFSARYNKNNFVVTNDMLAFFFGIHYGASVILQHKCDFFVYRALGTQRSEFNAKREKNALNALRNLPLLPKSDFSGTSIPESAVNDAFGLAQTLQLLSENSNPNGFIRPQL